MADATRELKIVISAQDEASEKISNVTRVGSYATDGLKTLGKAGVVASVAFGGLAIKSAFSASRVHELTVALHAIAKANNLSTKEVDTAVKALRGMNIEQSKALQITSLFVQSNLDLADAIKLANVAKDLAVIKGEDSSEATRNLTEAILTQRAVNLREYGIVTTLTEVYGEYAESIGKSADDLSELEKRQAFLHKILEKGKTVVGTYEASMTSAGKQFRSLTGRILPEFITAIGKAFEPALLVAVNKLTGYIEKMTKWIEDNQGVIEKWGEKIGKAVGIGFTAFEKIVTFLLNNKGMIVGALIAIAVGMALVLAPFILAGVKAGLVLAVFMLLGGVIGGLIKVIIGFKDTLISLKDAIIALPSHIQKAIEIIITRFNDMKDRVSNAVKKLFLEDIPYAIGWIVGFVTVAIPSLIGFVIQWFMELPPRIWSIFTSVVETIINKIKEAWAYIQKEVPQWIPRIVAFLKDLPGRIKAILIELKDAFVSKLSEIWSVITGWKDKVVGAFNAIIDTVKRAINTFREGLSVGTASASGLRSFQHGGFVPGAFHEAVPALLHGGERVIPRTGADVNNRGGGGGQPITIHFSGPVSMDSKDRVQQLADKIVMLLGRQSELAVRGISI